MGSRGRNPKPPVPGGADKLTDTPVRALTQTQRDFAENLARGMTARAAAIRAGFLDANDAATRLAKDPRVRALVAVEAAKFEKKNDLTRERVYQGFLEAIDIGRTISDPHAMIKGWEQIAKMAGYYAPDVKKIEVSIAAKRLTGQFERMTDEDLLKIAENEIIDVESREIPSETTQEITDALEEGAAKQLLGAPEGDNPG